MEEPSASFFGSGSCSVTLAAVQFGFTVGCASLSSAGRVMVIFVVPECSQPCGMAKLSRAGEFAVVLSGETPTWADAPLMPASIRAAVPLATAVAERARRRVDLCCEVFKMGAFQAGAGRVGRRAETGRHGAAARRGGCTETKWGRSGRSRKQG